MAGIPKKYKKNLKSQYKNSVDSPKTTRVWSFKDGDLVQYKDTCGIVLDASREDGYFQIMGPQGVVWAKGKDLYTVQSVKSKDKSDACNKDK